MTNSTSKLSITLAVISYITLIGTIIAYFMNKDKKQDPFVYFHVRQGLGIWLSYFLLGYFIGFFGSWLISTSFWVFFGVLIIYGIYTAIQGKQTKLPLVGTFYHKILKSIA